MTEACCWNCQFSVTECECEAGAETYESDDGPACPHCGHVNKASDSNGRLYEEGEHDKTCENCEQEFVVDVSISYAWYSSKP